MPHVTPARRRTLAALAATATIALSTPPAWADAVPGAGPSAPATPADGPAAPPAPPGAGLAVPGAGPAAPPPLAREGGVITPPLPVHKLPRQVGEACEIWRSMRWPEAGRRGKDHRVRDGEVIRGGGRYRNIGGVLPRGGRYVEYDVNPRHPGDRRDAERLVRDAVKKHVWYTSDHYRNFRQISSGCP
ncbi:ribonuclease domain-containing protein [Bailinhaonella thermotolerans]|uniref:Guanine-specific ribonuclease N1 and T1 n=1 Tax=Bailinhaonella thermotolerans TaxID=1070861 RepID=A0A3A4ANC2_9ACTN|nr:ribonuclease domain-containing protein [Bailinhaonella thermotolerans]RJL29965.1 guanine-specific ribonuclease N1 and T1 [Bailinhaonella thermotolerans]